MIIKIPVSWSQGGKGILKEVNKDFLKTISCHTASEAWTVPVV